MCIGLCGLLIPFPAEGQLCRVLLSKGGILQDTLSQLMIVRLSAK